MSTSTLPRKSATPRTPDAGLKYHIQTFGCQMNYSDTERVSAILEKSGYSKATTLEDVDLFIFNTCSIKQKGEDKVYGMIKNIASYKKANPRLLIGLTGCMVRQTSSKNSEKTEKDQLLKERSRLDFVFRITDTHKLPNLLAEAEPQLDLAELDQLNQPTRSAIADLTAENLTDYLNVTPNYGSQFQAFVPIQIGCDKYCTYCIVPYSRGREQSRPMEDIYQECLKLVENGCKEITLVGQTVNSYGLSALDKQKPLFTELEIHPFTQLLRRLDSLSEKGLNRLRYTSPHPRDLNDDLINAHATLKTLCPYIHLPIQSGDDEMLKRMNRKYTVAEYREKVARLLARVPNCCISTDIIVGFCGETDQQYQNTYDLFEEMQWDQAFISRYSERTGTVAGNYFKDDITAEQKADRWHRLNNLLKVVSRNRHKSFEGKTVEVLVERFNPLTSECEGRSREYKLVQFPGHPDQVGTIVQAKVLQGLDWVLKGCLI
ncbi:MAG: tRNA (N6-isopentenyl adenosine(37)-C2)-methylthiotransferase MiaB [Candidatus Altimarinota bacterium]